MMSINKINWNKLKDIEYMLRLYVHGWDIDIIDPVETEKDNVYECPRDHGHKMTIDKSFAWTLADRLKKIIDVESEIEMEDLLHETLMLHATFKRHKDEYPELYQMAKGIYRACHQKEKELL